MLFCLCEPTHFELISSHKSRKHMTDNKSYPFEASLAELEKLVEKMETGELSLERLWGGVLRWTKRGSAPGNRANNGCAAGSGLASGGARLSRGSLQ